MKRLSSPSGNVLDAVSKKSEAGSVIRKAILVHAGPGGSKIEFQSGDGAIGFDDARIKDIVVANNAYRDKMVSEYGGEAPDGAFPPILDHHNDTSNDHIRGRLIGKFSYERRDIPKVGKDVPCVVSEIKFLGAETVEKAADGRIYHLSVGIDEETNLLGELSTVIEPAAPGAMVLSKKKLSNKEKSMSKKRLALQKARLAKLESIGSTLKTLAGKAEDSKKLITLAKAESEVKSGLVRLMKAGKITPAEFKKLNLKKLAALPKEALDTVLEAYNALEPKVLMGQKGAADAVDFASIGSDLEKSQYKRLKAEAKADLKRMGAKVKESSEDKEMSSEEKVEKKMAGAMPEAKDEKKMAFDKSMKDLKACLEQGEVEGAKKALQSAEEAGYHSDMSLAEGSAVPQVDGTVISDDQKKSLEDIQKQVDELSTNVARVFGMVDELISAEKEEGHDLEAEEPEEKELEGDEPEEKKMEEEKPEDKKLSDDKDEDDKKLEGEKEEEKKLEGEKPEEKKEKLKKK